MLPQPPCIVLVAHTRGREYPIHKAGEDPSAPEPGGPVVQPPDGPRPWPSTAWLNCCWLPGVPVSLLTLADSKSLIPLAHPRRTRHCPSRLRQERILPSLSELSDIHALPGLDVPGPHMSTRA